MPRALGLVLVCKLAASVISTRIDSLPQAPTVAVLVEAISGAPDTLLTIKLPSKHQTSTQEPETRLQRRAPQQTSDQPKEKEKRQKKATALHGIYLYELLRHSLPGPNSSWLSFTSQTLPADFHAWLLCYFCGSNLDIHPACSSTHFACLSFKFRCPKTVFAANDEIGLTKTPCSETSICLRWGLISHSSTDNLFSGDDAQTLFPVSVYSELLMLFSYQAEMDLSLSSPS